MEDEKQEQEKPVNETPDNLLKNKNIIIAVLIVIVVILLGIFLLSRSNNPTAQKVTQPIVNIINRGGGSQKTSPTPTPSTDQKGNSEISGTITFTGTIPTGSTAAIAVKSKTNPTYRPLVSELKAENTVAWKWDGAIKGNNYDVQAYLLDSSGNLKSQSQAVNVTSPKEKIELTINYTTLAAPPADSLKVSCSKKDDKTKKWQVTMTYNINNPTSSAKQYRLGVGTSRSGELLVDKVVKPKSPDTSQSFTTEFVVTEGATHYAAYAYAKCEDCDEFSPTSLWEEFRCNEPTGTPSPTPSS